MASSSVAVAQSQSEVVGAIPTHSDTMWGSPYHTKPSSHSASDDIMIADGTVADKDISPSTFTPKDSSDDLPDEHSRPCSSAKSSVCGNGSERRNSNASASRETTNGLGSINGEDEYVDDGSDDGFSDEDHLREDQELFETQKPKIVQLCIDLGYGEPSTLQSMRGGSFNRIVGITFLADEKKEYILRIPRYEWDEDQAHELVDQVAVHLHLSKYEFLHSPLIAAWDATKNNALQTQYILQERLRGQCLQDVFYQLPLREKLQIATIVAETLLKLETITFENVGRLVGSGTLPSTSLERPSSKDVLKVVGYRDNPMQDGPVLEKQPITTLLIALLEHRKQRHMNWTAHVEKCERLQKIVLQMQDAGLMRNGDHDSVLWHWDLSASNILINREVATETSVDATENQTSPATCHNDGTQSSDGMSSGRCHHSVNFEVDGGSKHGESHTISINLDGQPDTICCHKVDVTVEGHSGTKYHHSVHIVGGEEKETKNFSRDADEVQTSDEITSGDWTISGVLDWDNALAVPLVLSRKPPSWLWLDEEQRPNWTGNRDREPHRDLTGDELLIKAHFDQVMARASPTYLEDAYGRGVWLRALARFGIYPFEDSDDLDRYEPFVEAWESYYASLGKSSQS